MSVKDVLRCLHRHDIDAHPTCFATGAVKVDERADKTIPWYKVPGMKIGYLDIESDGLKADFSTMLTWCLKEKDGEVFNDVITKKELFAGQGDRRIINSLVEKMREFRIIVTYFGTVFDLPFVRTKALHYDIDFPSYAELYHFDLFYTVKSKLNLSRKSLDAATDYLNIEGKTPIDRESWRRAKYGEVEALREVLSHNVADVVILEQLHNKLTPFVKWTKRSV